ncbi:MAG: YkvA family protein [Pseudomonadota bacterium]
MDDVKIGEILEPDEDQKGANEKRVRDGFWPKFKRAAGALPFADEVLSAYYCAMDPETPSRVRGVLFAALAYFILPLDSLPDFIVGFGFTDDIAVLTAAFAAVRGNITDAHRAAAKQTLNEWKTAESKPS